MFCLEVFDMNAKICDICDHRIRSNIFFTFKKVDRLYETKTKMHMCKDCYFDLIEFLDNKDKEGEKT